MTRILNPDEIRELGRVLTRIRPQWDPPGIRTALETALTEHPYPDVALVAIASARDPRAATPAVIGVRCRNGWTGNDHVEPSTTRQPPRFATCQACGRLHTGEECSGPRRADYASGAAAAKAALTEFRAAMAATQEPAE